MPTKDTNNCESANYVRFLEVADWEYSFATTVTLANGVPIETVSKMLGHTDIKTTQIYAKIVDQKLSSDMDSLAMTYKKKYANK